MALGVWGGLGAWGSKVLELFSTFDISKFSFIDNSSSCSSRSRVSKTVYIGRNSPISISVLYDDEAMNFVDQGVVAMGVTIKGIEYTSDDGYIEFDNNGLVTFRLGDIPNPPRNPVIARLVMYRSDSDKGTPILTERTKYEIEFQFA